MSTAQSRTASQTDRTGRRAALLGAAEGRVCQGPVFRPVSDRIDLSLSVAPARARGGDAASGEEVRRFTRDHIDAARIDRESRIPDEVVRGLGQIGVLGMCVSPQYGGRGFSQQQYCRIMEVIGAHCGGTTVFVNAHHSIGLRALVLFGTTEQKERWLPPLPRGETLAAFALTEPEAGSDAANVRTHGDAHARRPRLHAQRRQTLHHQRRASPAC